MTCWTNFDTAFAFYQSKIVGVNPCWICSVAFSLSWSPPDQINKTFARCKSKDISICTVQIEQNKKSCTFSKNKIKISRGFHSYLFLQQFLFNVLPQQTNTMTAAWSGDIQFKVLQASINENRLTFGLQSTRTPWYCDKPIWTQPMRVYR